MKNFMGIFFLLMVFAQACNNDTGKQTTETTKPVEQFISAREKELKDSIAKFPQNLQLKEALFELYKDSADFDKAIATIDDVLKTDSLNDALWAVKGGMYFENDDKPAAITAYESAYRLNPSPSYLLLLGSLYAQTKNAKALAVANLLQPTKQFEKEAWFIKGMYYNYNGDKPAAIAALDKCLALDGRYMLAYREKGIALFDLQKYDDAITVLDKAVTLQNNFDEGYYWLGRCFEKQNKIADAVEEYKTALLYSPDYEEAKEALQRLGAK